MKYHSDANLTLYCGDCRQLIDSVDEYDLTFTSPPYGIGVNYGVGKDDWLADRAFWKQFRGTKLLVQVSAGQLHWWLDEIRAGGWTYQHCLVFINPDKANRTYDNFPKHWEPVLVFNKGKEIRINKTRAMLSSDIFTISAPENSWYRYPVHPCHADYYTWLRILSQFDFDTLFDPFAGIGTAMLAARYFGRKAIGIEQNPDYCRQAVEFFNAPVKR